MSKASGLLKASKLALTHGYWQIRCDQKALTPVPWNFLKQILGSKEKQANRKMNMQQDKNKGRFMPQTKGDSCPKWREIHKRNEGRFIHKTKEIHARNKGKVSQRDERGCWLVYSDFRDGRFLSASCTVWSHCLRIPQAESQNSLEHVFPPRRPWLTLLTQTLFKTYSSCR